MALSPKERSNTIIVVSNSHFKTPFPLLVFLLLTRAIVNNRGKSQFHRRFSAVSWPLPLRKCHDLLENDSPRVFRTLGKTEGEQTRCTEGPGSTKPAPLPPPMSPSPTPQTRIYRMDTRLCSKSKVPYHVEWLYVPKLACQVSYIWLMLAGKDIMTVWSLSWGLQRACWRKRTWGTTHTVRCLS